MDNDETLAVVVPKKRYNIAVTLKPCCSNGYALMSQHEQLNTLRCTWDWFCKQFDRDELIKNELHFERFNNGNLHAHGYITLPLREDKEHEENIHDARVKVHMLIGKHGKNINLNLSSTVKYVTELQGWLEYINKSNVYPPYDYRWDEPSIWQPVNPNTKCKRCKHYKVVCSCIAYKHYFDEVKKRHRHKTVMNENDDVDVLSDHSD